MFGTNATELVHIGQTLMAFNGTVDHLVETVFNYPTLAESYKVAALDATNKLRTISTVSASAALGLTRCIKGARHLLFTSRDGSVTLGRR